MHDMKIKPILVSLSKGSHMSRQLQAVKFCFHNWCSYWQFKPVRCTKPLKQIRHSSSSVCSQFTTFRLFADKGRLEIRSYGDRQAVSVYFHYCLYRWNTRYYSTGPDSLRQQKPDRNLKLNAVKYDWITFDISV